MKITNSTNIGDKYSLNIGAEYATICNLCNYIATILYATICNYATCHLCNFNNFMQLYATLRNLCNYMQLMLPCNYMQLYDG